MAKIVFFPSIFDDTKYKEISHKGTIEEALKDLKIQDESLCITINGETPDICNLEYKCEDDDVIEIRRIVHGSASDKQALATIVQLAALIALSVGTFGTGTMIAIALGSSLIAGALNRKAQEMMMKSNANESEVSIETNNYSLTNASNEARPLNPLPLIMGNLRLAPDIHTDAHKTVFNNEYTGGYSDPVDSVYIPGIYSNNGPEAANNNWAIMPAGFIATNFPMYDIKIEPYNFNPPPGPLSPADNLAIITSVKNSWLANGNPSKINYLTVSLSGEVRPLVVYHHHPSDPMRYKFNLFHFLARWHESLGPLDFWSVANYTKAFTNLFAGTTYSASFPAEFLFNNEWRWVGTAVFNNALLIINPAGYMYPAAFTSVVTNKTTLMSMLGTYLTAINGGSYAGSAVTNSYDVAKMYNVLTIGSVEKEGVPVSTQVFNYGIGDLTIVDRRIGKVDVDLNDQNIAVYSEVRRDTSSLGWLIDPVFTTWSDYFYIFYTNVFALDRKELANPDVSHTFTDPNDNNQYNFIFLEGKLGYSRLDLGIIGNLYATSGGGFVTNSCLIEMQWKLSNDTSWTSFTVSGAIVIENNNPKRLYYKVQLTPSFVPDDQRIQVRIRKITLDATNNEDQKVCKLYVDDVRFTRDNLYYLGRDSVRLLNAPMNLEGVGITSLVSDVAQTTKFTARVYSACWVYDFEAEEWIWDLNRNPAFWFLYFAYGGFKNLNSDGSYIYPYSPTKGWVNYPGHPDSTEHIFGVGLTQDEIDMDKILEWAEFCKNKNLFMDMVLKDDISCAEALERIANIGRASVSYYNGKLSVIYENNEQIPTCLFGMGNILAGSFSVDYNVGDPVRKIVAKFTNGFTWETDQVEAIVPYSNDENLKVVEVSFDGIVEPHQAQREVNILAARQFFQRRSYTWGVDVEGLQAKRGDLVYLSHDSTQYGYSGRISSFIMNGTIIDGFRTSSILDEDIKWVTIREPNGAMQVYACHLVGDTVYFDDPYPIEKAPVYINPTTDNNLSLYPKSIPEDFIFIAGAKETPGKIVRISEIQANEDLTFTITAVDEDPAMWSYEYQNLPDPPPALDPESFDNSEVVLSVKNVELTDMGNGLVKVNWESVNGDYINIINEVTGLPIEASGSYTFTGGQVVLELTAGSKYNLIIRPFAIGTAYKSEDYKVSIWLK